jgi:hypothetical protein
MVKGATTNFGRGVGPLVYFSGDTFLFISSTEDRMYSDRFLPAWVAHSSVSSLNFFDTRIEGNESVFTFNQITSSTL